MTDNNEFLQSLESRFRRLIDGAPPEQSDYCDGLVAGFRLCLNRVRVWIEEEEQDV